MVGLNVGYHLSGTMSVLTPLKKCCCHFGPLKAHISTPGAPNFKNNPFFKTTHQEDSFGSKDFEHFFKSGISVPSAEKYHVRHFMDFRVFSSSLGWGGSFLVAPDMCLNLCAKFYLYTIFV